MAAAILDTKTALSAIDLQKGIVSYPTVHPVAEAVKNASRLPAALINVAGVAPGQAHERGFNVTLAIDAMTDMSADAHANSITGIFPPLGETGSTQKIITLLRKLPA